MENFNDAKLLNPITKLNSIFSICLSTNEHILEESIICVICLTAIDIPNETNCCGQLICSICLRNLQSSSYYLNACPYCKARPLKTSISRLLSYIVGEIKIGCDFCMNKVKHKELEKHLITNCTGVNEIIREDMKSYNELVQFTQHPHMFKRMRSPLPSFNCLGENVSKYQCKSCVERRNNPGLLNHSESNQYPLRVYQCTECPDIMICSKCLFFNKMEFGIYHCSHPHLLYPVQRLTTWCCNMRSNNPNCLSFSTSLDWNSKRFRCQDCDFDLCGNCILVTNSQYISAAPVQQYVLNDSDSFGFSANDDINLDEFGESDEEDLWEDELDDDLNMHEHHDNWDDDDDFEDIE